MGNVQLKIVLNCFLNNLYHVVIIVTLCSNTIKIPLSIQEWIMNQRASGHRHVIPLLRGSVF